MQVVYYVRLGIYAGLAEPFFHTYYIDTSLKWPKSRRAISQMQCPEILLGTNEMSQGRQDIFLLKVSQDTFEVYVLTAVHPLVTTHPLIVKRCNF